MSGSPGGPDKDQPMDSFELSKIAGAAFAALLLIFGTKTLIEMRQQDHGAEPAAHSPAKPEAHPAAAAPEHAAATPAPATGTAPAATTAPAAAPAAAPAVAAPPAKAAGIDTAKILSMVAGASPENGKATFAKCLACHTNEKGLGNKLGPNLWNVLGRQRASIADFTGYSANMKAKGGEWTYEDLATFVYSPSGFVQGTKMIFPGVKDPAAIADLLAYIRTLGDNPPAPPK